MTGYLFAIFAVFVGLGSGGIDTTTQHIYENYYDNKYICDINNGQSYDNYYIADCDEFILSFDKEKLSYRRTRKQELFSCEYPTLF